MVSSVAPRNARGRARARPPVDTDHRSEVRELTCGSVGIELEGASGKMNTRTISTLGILATLMAVAVPGSAQSAKTLDGKVDGMEMADGKVRATLITGYGQAVMPGDKGFFLKDGEKVAGSEFEVDRIDERSAFVKTGFKSPAELRAQTSKKARISVATRKCPRGGKRPEFDDKETRDGKEPAEGFAFANVKSAEKVHKSKIRVIVDKGTNDGVLPGSTGYAVGDERRLSGYMGVESVGAKTATIVIDAVEADKAVGEVKRIAFERLICK